MENITIPQRTCGTCTECCKGWLWGDAYGKPFYSGHPCHFLGNGYCTIYDKRPESPCRTYLCAWMRSDEFPEWFKPENSKVVMTFRNWGKNNENTYVEVRECGQKIDSSVLNWIFLDVLNNNRCYKIQIDNGWNNYGTPEFLEWVRNNIHE